jgi:hypothetical protein
MKSLSYVICMLGLFGAEAQAKNPMSSVSPTDTCEEVATIAEIKIKLRVGESAFASFDTDSLMQTALETEALVACLSEPMTPEVAASYHRLMALTAFVRGDDDDCKLELHASFRLEDSYVFPTQVAPEGHPLLLFYEEAKTLSSGEPETLYPPNNGGYVSMDGQVAQEDAVITRPSQTPVIVQAFSSEGQIIETVYVRVGEEVPRWGTLDLTLPLEVPIRNPSPVLKKTLPWYISGGASLALGVVTYGIALDQQRRFLDTSEPDDADSLEILEGYRSRANLFGGTAIGLGVVGIGLVSNGMVLQIRFGGSRTESDSTVVPGATEGEANGP